MTDTPSLERLAQVIRTSFKQPDAVVSAATVADDIAGWDSLGHVILLMNVEREFSIRFALAEVIGLEQVGDLTRMIDRKLAHGSPA